MPRTHAEVRVRGAVAGLLLGSLPVFADAFDGLQTSPSTRHPPATMDQESSTGLTNSASDIAQGNVQDGAPGDGRTADVTGLILPLLGALCLVARRRYADRRS